MDIYFAGAEQPTYLRKLIKFGVTHVSVSFFTWRQQHSDDDIEKFIPEEMSVCVTAGVARKEGLDFDAFAKDYLEFCDRNVERAVMYDMDAASCPEKIRRSTRNMLSLMPNSVLFPIDADELAELAGKHENIGINSRMAKSIPSNELRRLPATLYGSNITDQRTLRLARFTATVTLSWLAGRRYGELWVFARGQMHHYDAEELKRAVHVHREDIEALGVDPEACLANDREALTEIGVRSLQALGLGLSRRARDRQSDQIAVITSETSESKDLHVDPATPDTLTHENGALPVVQRERVLLPIVAMNVLDDGTKVSSIAESLRRCDSCYLSDHCPRYEVHHACAFELPVEFRNDEQWEAACQVLLEFQFQRVSFGYFAEQVDGGGLTARLGQEMDRYYKMLESLKELKTPAPAANNGMMSQFFGPPSELLAGPEAERGEEDTSEEGDEEDLEADFGAIDAWLASEEEESGEGD